MTTLSTTRLPFFGPDPAQPAIERFAHSAIEKMVDNELRHATPRSAEYRQGMLDLLSRNLNDEPMARRYQPGSAQFDAYCAGVDRGWVMYRAMSKGAAKKKAQ